MPQRAGQLTPLPDDPAGFGTKTPLFTFASHLR